MVEPKIWLCVRCPLHHRSPSSAESRGPDHTHTHKGGGDRMFSAGVSEPIILSRSHQAARSSTFEASETYHVQHFADHPQRTSKQNFLHHQQPASVAHSKLCVSSAYRTRLIVRGDPSQTCQRNVITESFSCTITRISPRRVC